MKKIMAGLLSLILTAGLALGSAPIRVHAEAGGDGWGLDDEGVLTISSNAGMNDWRSSGH